MKNDSKSPPRILITNDDGIHAPGIELLEEIARDISDDIWVVAPAVEQSGAGHSISISNVIRARQLDERHFQISGTPTDCVLMAWYEFIDGKKPDLLLSGINSGANLAEDVSYSGTIAAAMEGTLLGIRSIALSQIRPVDGTANFAPARKFAPEVLKKLAALEDWPADSFINVNFPDVNADEITDIRLTSQGQRPPGTFSVDSRTDPRGQPYFWIKIAHNDGGEVPESDLHAIADKAVSVTPIKMDFTDYAWRKRLHAVL